MIEIRWTSRILPQPFDSMLKLPAILTGLAILLMAILRPVAWLAAVGLAVLWFAMFVIDLDMQPEVQPPPPTKLRILTQQFTFLLFAAGAFALLLARRSAHK